VPANLIDSLVRAIDAPPVDQFKTSDLGITQKWLEDNVETARRKNERSSRYGSDIWLPSFRAAFTNQALVESAVGSLFSGFHTDDYPCVEISVVFENGEKWSASSNSQYEFMVPWQIKDGVRAFTTWNVNLSKAVAALLPKGAVNLGRLEGEHFSYDLGNAVMEHLKEQWMSPVVSLLKGRYTVERAEIWAKRVSALRDRGSGRPENIYMDVRFGGGTLPKWLHVSASLPVQEGAVVGADEALRLASDYANLVLAVPWLDRWMTDHEQSAWIVLEGSRSFHDEAVRIFDADMKAMGKESLRREVLAAMEQVVLISVESNSAFWLVLPDRRVVLWRFRSLTNIPRTDSRHGLLKWSWADFQTTERLDAWSPWRECAGALVSAEGDLIR